MAERRYPMSEARNGGWEELPHVRGQGQWPRGANPLPRPGAAAEETPRIRGQGGDREVQPHAQGLVTVRAQEGLEEPSHVEGQEGRQEEILLIQGKEQRLCFAGAAVKRYPTPKARETQIKMIGVTRGHQRADTLKPYSQKTSQSNHTRTTALSNSMKPSHAHGATQDGWVMVERSDRM